MALSRKPRSTSLEAQAYDQFSSSVPTGLGGFLLINLVDFSLCLLFVSRVFSLIDLATFSPQSAITGLGGFLLAT